MDRTIEQILPAIRMMLDGRGLKTLRLLSDDDPPPAAGGSMLSLPDFTDLDEVRDAIEWYREAKGRAPDLIHIEGIGTLAVGDATASGRMRGRVAIVTGAAQGFGEGIARCLADEGACVVVADLNEVAGRTAADAIGALFVKTDVSDHRSVEALVRRTVEEFGGVDLFVSNAGVLRAGDIESMTPETFDFVTRVNYNAWFYCVKAVAPVMKIQNQWAPENYGDMVQINSKSGLRGSRANFAYAGGKFGGVGLTQSFALELAPHRIKVNSVCPGNFYDGPLWSDPENGLFVQYLAAGKVPGAKTIDDVRRHYMAQVPMGKGTTPEDVARAVMYLVEQTCETGQALPVTGGQIMLN